MKTPILTRWLGAVMLSGTFVACAPENPGGGGGAGDAASDTGVQGDESMGVTDAGPVEDVRQTDAGSPDAPSKEDVPVTEDVPAAEDVAPGEDAAPADDWMPGDSGTLDDAVTTPDGPPPQDVPASPDLPSVDVPNLPDVPVTPDVPRDTGAAVDTGPAPDVGPLSCTAPLARVLVLPRDTVMATSTGTGRYAAGCAQSGGPENLHPFRVTQRSGVMLSTSAMFDTVLSVRRLCDDPRTEIACNDDVSGSLNSLVRRVLDPGEYYAIVDQYGMGGTGGSYSLSVATYTPAANSECGAAQTLTPGTAVAGDTTGGGPLGTGCLTSSHGPQVYYALTIPAGQRATVTANPVGTPPWQPVLRAFASCDSTGVCLSNGRSPVAGMPGSEAIDNRGTAPLRVIVSVASVTATTGGLFSLSAALTPAVPAPTNASCATARVVSNSTVTGENGALATTRLQGLCVGGATSPVLFYRVNVPQNSTLVATATPRPGFNPAVRLLSSCSANACLASASTAGAGTPEVLTYANRGASQDFIVAVGGADGDGTGTFDLGVQVLPQPANVSCAAAAPIANGAVLRSQNSALGADNATAACVAGSTGTVLWYRAVVGPRQTLALRAAPVTATMRPMIRVMPGCGATSCLANALAPAAGQAASLMWTNPGNADATVIVAVGGETNAANGLFDLTVTQTRGYALAAIPVQCDDMAGATALAGVTGDDAVTAAADLPFGFALFGDRMLEYTVSTNGLLQLFPSLPATGSASFDNVAIPTAAAPNGMIAAFWDDLYAESASRVLVRTLGAAPARRFVVQWTDFSHYADRSTRITMQARLFEGTNVIELHYCRVVPGTMMAPLASGSTATIGIESASGTLGTQHSLNRAGAVASMSALRFSP